MGKKQLYWHQSEPFILLDQSNIDEIREWGKGLYQSFVVKQKKMRSCCSINKDKDKKQKTNTNI